MAIKPLFKKSAKGVYTCVNKEVYTVDCFMSDLETVHTRKIFPVGHLPEDCDRLISLEGHRYKEDIYYSAESIAKITNKVAGTIHYQMARFYGKLLDAEYDTVYHTWSKHHFTIMAAMPGRMSKPLVGNFPIYKRRLYYPGIAVGEVLQQMAEGVKNTDQRAHLLASRAMFLGDDLF